MLARDSECARTQIRDHKQAREHANAQTPNHENSHLLRLLTYAPNASFLAFCSASTWMPLIFMNACLRTFCPNKKTFVLKAASSLPASLEQRNIFANL